MKEVRATIHIRTIYPDEFQRIHDRRQLFLTIPPQGREMREGDVINFHEIEMESGARTGRGLAADVTCVYPQQSGRAVIGIQPRTDAVGKTIYERALILFGEDKQLDQTGEEFAEFIVAINHFKRGRVGKEKLAEECADAENMIAQVRLIVGGDAVDKIKSFKLDRFEKVLAALEAKG